MQSTCELKQQNTKSDATKEKLEWEEMKQKKRKKRTHTYTCMQIHQRYSIAFAIAKREMRLRKRKASPLQRLAQCKQYACAFDKLYVLCCAVWQQQHQHQHQNQHTQHQPTIIINIKSYKAEGTRRVFAKAHEIKHSGASKKENKEK